MIMPIGIIEYPTEDGATFILTRPGDHNILKVNSPVMVRNTHRDDGDIPSGVMVRSQVTEIGPTTATFKVVESKIGPYWPKDADTLAPGCAGPWTAASPITPGPVQLRLALLRALGPGPRRPGNASFPAPRRRLPSPPSRGAPPLGGHRLAPPSHDCSNPQGRWPRRSHRQPRRMADHEGHRHW